MESTDPGIPIVSEEQIIQSQAKQQLSDWAATSDFQLLKVYSYYRTLLGSSLLLLYSWRSVGTFMSVNKPTVFVYTLFIYIVLGIATMIFLWRQQTQPRTAHVTFILATDIIAIVLLMHATLGSDGSLGYLLLVCIATSSMLLRTNISIALSGFTTLLIFFEVLYSGTNRDIPEQQLFSAGVLGILLFATAFIFRFISEKIRKTNLEAMLQAEQAAYLENLSHMILERMRTGIIVVNADDNIVLINRAARSLLGLANRSAVETDLMECPQVKDHLSLWRAFPHSRSPNFKPSAEQAEVRISFAMLEQHPRSDTLIFVEDNLHLSQQAQQLKLASLGRLTASIAHEIRNPLGAISHAAQLLSESDTVPADDQRLCQIIQNHSHRVNHIIENVLQLSRRKNSLPEILNLADWMPNFIHDYLQGNPADIDFHCDINTVRTRIDPSQLQQVLTNLFDNGLRYSQENVGKKCLSVNLGIDKDSDLPYIEVIDEGRGVPEEDIEQVFEPFYTTASTGSGLGLYISRELCEANQASLDYRRTENAKSCFRINFAHPERIF